MRALLNAFREGRAVIRAETPTHHRFRDHLTVILIVTVGVDLACAVLAYFLEHHSRETQIKNFGSAFFWTSTQLLTVSSSITNPISFGGRALDIFMEAYAVTVIAALAGAFGSFLHKRGLELEKERSPGG